MPFIETGIEGLLVFEPKVFEDSRGYFFEAYNADTFSANGVHYKFIQDNQSSSSYGVIRGLHFQKDPHAQTKLVRALTGKILDVAVDIRDGSPTYGKAFSIELSGENKKQLLIPKGFAHGFSVLSDRAEVFYKCDSFYNRESDGGIYFADPALAIDWKIEVSQAIVSDKDQHLPVLAGSKHNFTFRQ